MRKGDLITITLCIDNDKCIEIKESDLKKAIGIFLSCVSEKLGLEVIIEYGVSNDNLHKYLLSFLERINKKYKKNYLLFLDDEY